MLGYAKTSIQSSITLHCLPHICKLDFYKQGTDKTCVGESHPSPFVGSGFGCPLLHPLTWSTVCIFIGPGAQQQIVLLHLFSTLHSPATGWPTCSQYCRLPMPGSYGGKWRELQCQCSGKGKSKISWSLRCATRTFVKILEEDFSVKGRKCLLLYAKWRNLPWFWEMGICKQASDLSMEVMYALFCQDGSEDFHLELSLFYLPVQSLQAQPCSGLPVLWHNKEKWIYPLNCHNV